MTDLVKIAIIIITAIIASAFITGSIVNHIRKKKVYRQFIYQRNMYDLGLINHMATRRDMPIVVRLDCMGDLIYAMLNNFSMKHKLKEDDGRILKDWEDIMNSCRRTISVDFGYPQDIVSNFGTCVSNWFKARNYLPMFEQMQIAHDLYTIFKLTVYEHEQELAKQQVKDRKQSKPATKPADGKHVNVAIVDELHSAPEAKPMPTAGEIVQTLMDAAHMQGDAATPQPKIGGDTASVLTPAGTGITARNMQ